MKQQEETPSPDPDNEKKFLHQCTKSFVSTIVNEMLHCRVSTLQGYLLLHHPEN